MSAHPYISQMVTVYHHFKSSVKITNNKKNYTNIKFIGLEIQILTSFMYIYN